MEKKHPLDDLSFFKFPDLTQEIVRNIILLFLLIAAVVIITILLQRWFYFMGSKRRSREAATFRADRSRKDPESQKVIEKLLSLSGVRGGLEALLVEAEAFERVVERFVREATTEELDTLRRLRRSFHQTVMNPELELISTRQLLEDIPLRIITTIGKERLDLYCSVMKADERFLYFDLAFHQEVFQLLADFPDIRLVHWSEERGETNFPIRLEPVAGGSALPVFRAAHAFNDQSRGKRQEFRLTVDLPTRYHYVAPESLRKLRGEQDGAKPAEGEGAIRDLSYGGAAFISDHALAAGGFAQLQFSAHEKPLRIMVEVTSSQWEEGSGFLIRGKLRGMAEDAKSTLYHFISREQVKRIREREQVYFSNG